MIRRVPHCAHWGAHTLLVEDGQIIGVEPFEHDTAPSDMIKATRHWLDPRYRISEPMVREGWLRDRLGSDRSGRGRDRFVPVSWDEAAQLVAHEIMRVRETFGSPSIFAGSYGWASSGRFHHASSQLHRMMNAAGGYTAHRDTYSLAAGPVIIRHVLGDETAVYGGANSYENWVENCEILLVFGALSPRTSQIDSGGIDIHRLQGYLRRVAERGVRVVLVSPMREDLADLPDAEWWPIRPNTDTALMLAMAREIVRAGRHDQSFLDRHCSGSQTFLDYLSGLSDGVEKTAEWAQAITDIPAARIRELALAMTQRRTMTTVSWSLQRAEHGEQPYWAALGMSCVIGQIGLPGGGVGYGYASTGALGANLGQGKSPAFGQLKSGRNDFIPCARIADALLNPGGVYEYDGETRAYPDIRMVYWAGGNPFHHHQDLGRLDRAWQRPETIVVQDPVWTPTAQRADIVLPATSTLERNDLAGTARLKYIFAMHKAVEPVGKSRTDYDICTDIATRLGVDQIFTEGRNEMDWIRHLYEVPRLDALERLNFVMPEFDEFWERGYAEVPTVTDHTFLADYRGNPEAHPLKTETGRILLASTLLTERAYDDCPPHPSWIEPREWLGTRDRNGALHMLSQQPRTRLHSQLDYAPVSAGSKTDGHEWIMLNADDARDRGIEESMRVLVSNARGKCLAVARLRTDLRRDVCILPTGAWFQPEMISGSNEAVDVSGNPNVLTQDRGASQFSQGCAAQSCLVQVEPHLGALDIAMDTPDFTRRRNVA